MYLIFMCFPFIAGGGYFLISGKRVLFSLDVLIFLFLSVKILVAISITCKILCFFFTDEKIIGTNVNGFS